jgi:hypothetical protein
MQVLADHVLQHLGLRQNTSPGPLWLWTPEVSSGSLTKMTSRVEVIGNRLSHYTLKVPLSRPWNKLLRSYNAQRSNQEAFKGERWQHLSPPATGATGAPPVNRTYIKVLIGWNTSTKSASDEFGFKKLEIYPRNCQSTLRKTTVRQHKLTYNLEGPGTQQKKSIFLRV